MADNIDNLQTHEIELLKKEIYLELRTLTDSSLNDFIFDLKQILSTNHLDKSYDIVFSLLRDAEFCFQSLCYSLPIFSSINGNIVAVNVQSTKQSLAKGYYISCTILPNQRTSIYSHQMAILDNNMLHFKEEGLASLSFADLKNPKVDFLTRNIVSEDKLVDQFYPIYSGQKVSLQCLDSVHITVDQQKMWCDQKSIQFIDFPRKITINGKTILTVHIPQHFSMKMAQMTHDFEVLTQFSNINVTEPHLVQEIVSYFEIAQPIHWSLFTLVLVSICSIVVLLCCCCYLKCPNVMSKIFSCCCNSSCCLLKCFTKRVLEKTAFRSRVDAGYNIPSETVQMLDINHIQPAANPNLTEIFSLNSNRPNVIPSAPIMNANSTISNRGIVINQNGQPVVPGHLSDCKAGYPSCFCRKGNQQCQGPIQRPPF